MHHTPRLSLGRRLAGGTAALALAISLSACTADAGDPAAAPERGSAADQSLQIEIGKLNFDPAKYCGDKPMRIGNITGFGGNTWMVEVRAIIDTFKEHCSNISEIQYYDANGDVTKFNSTISAWAAQDFDLIYGFTGTFGSQTMPAFKEAQKAGVKIGVSNVSLGDAAVPESVTASVVQDIDDMARQWMEFFDSAKTEGPAQIVMIGGTAGAPLDAAIVASMKRQIKETGAEVTFLQDEPLIGNWDVAESAKAIASVIPKYKEIDGVLLTNAVATPAVVRAFENAGRPIPALGGTGISSGAVCEVAKVRAKNPEVQMLSLDGTGNVGPLALIKAIASFQGIDAPELGPTDAETYVKLAPYVDTLNDVFPACDAELPADADPSMALTKAQVLAAVK